jgi:hypothetical protein
LREELGIAQFDQVVDALLADKILLELSGRLLALAVDADRREPRVAPCPGGRIEWAQVI